MKTIYKNFIFMVMLAYLSSALTLALNNNTVNDTILIDTLNKIDPKIDIKVDKEYDDQGNIIRYDSSYSYYYLDSENVPHHYFFTPDSLFNEIFPFYYDSLNKSHHHPFDDDLFNEDFFNDPFFRGFQYKDYDYNELMERMDSLRNEFFKQYFPEENDIHQNAYEL